MQNQAAAARLSRADVILLACGPITVLFILDGYFKHSLYSYSPALFWLFDGVKFVLLPAAILIWLGRRHGITPAQYGMRAIAENESWEHFLGLAVFLAFVLTLVYQVAFYLSWYMLGFPETTAFYHSIRPEAPLRIPVILYYGITAGIVARIDRSMELLVIDLDAL